MVETELNANRVFKYYYDAYLKISKLDDLVIFCHPINWMELRILFSHSLTLPNGMLVTIASEKSRTGTLVKPKLKYLQILRVILYTTFI